MGVYSAALQIGFGPDKKEDGSLREVVQSGKIQITAIHDIESAGFQGDEVEAVDFVKLAIGDVDKRRNASAEIQKCMEFDCAFGFAEIGRWKHGQAQIDCCCVER